jgi:Na+/phosphate symporter
LGANIGTTGTIWLAGIMVSDGMSTGITKQIVMVHTGVNALMAVMLLPFIQPIARFISKF